MMFRVSPEFAVEDDTISGNIYTLYKANTTYNFIIVNQIFDRLDFPDNAADSLFKSVEPGGAVMYTTPKESKIQMVPDDLRYTKTRVKETFERAGFCVPEDLMAGAGDAVFDVGRALGLRSSDFADQDLDASYHLGYDAIPLSANRIYALAFKAPNERCPS